MKINFIDLFAGAGGLSEGFLREEFNPVAFVEKDENACNTLKTRLAYYYLKDSGKINIYNAYLQGKLSRIEFYGLVPDNVLKKVINREINENTLNMIFEEIDALLRGNKVDIILGGPPCQTYSIAGRSRMGDKIKKDFRNYLFKYYIEFLKKYRPYIFIFENVPGLLSAENGKYFKEMISGFEKLGYNNFYQILNSADYGVIQNRKRIFISGIKDDKNFTFPEPDRSLSNGYTLKDLFYDLPESETDVSVKVFFYKEKENDYLKKSLIRNDMEFTTLHITRPVNEKDKKIYRIAIQKFMETGEQLKYTELPDYLKTHKNQFSFIDRFKVLNPEGLSHTIVSHLSKDGHYYIYPDYNNPRSISIREAARIQSFPDDYFFEGSRTSCYQQIGNAVPVLLAQALAKQIKGIIS